MKKTIIALLIISAMACACSRTDNVQVITEYVRASFPGIMPGYNVTVHCMAAPAGTVTVTDSLRIIASEFEADRGSKIHQMETALETLRSLAALQAANSYVSESEKSASADGIESRQAILDSLRSLEIPEAYVGRGASDVLATVVRCCVRVEETPGGRSLEDTYDFYISPNGTRVYSHTRAR